MYDNLNRMTKSIILEGSGLHSWTYEHDILGNRIRRNATTNNHAYPMRYDWDVLNRASTIAKPSGGASYSYRADGQRIEKVEGVTFAWVGSKTSGQYDTNYATNRPSSRYYYDGQMGFEDDYNPSGTVTQVNRYILGARGIDRVARTESGNTTLAYPMYDGHGNMRALLSRNGTSYSTGNWKTYDVWGSVRSGGSSADPKQGYVASIGHVNDSESSLIYMRARYYEPATGRFLSQDPAADGSNWFIYCRNNPITLADETGMSPFRSVAAGASFLGFFIYFLINFLGNNADMNSKKMVSAAFTLIVDVLTGAAVTFLDFMFPTLNRMAKAYASEFGVGAWRYQRRLACYEEFWIGYGFFLGFLLDIIDLGESTLDNWSGKESWFN